MEMEGKRAQRIRRIVHVLDPLGPAQYTEWLLQARGDVIGDPLLPIRCETPPKRVVGSGGQDEREEREHGDSDEDGNGEQARGKSKCPADLGPRSRYEAAQHTYSLPTTDFHYY